MVGDRNSPRRDTTRGFYSRRVFARNKLRPAEPLNSPAWGQDKPRDRSAVVAPDPSRDPTATTSKFWGVTWVKRERQWEAQYTDATGKKRYIGYYDTQEAAAHAVNAAIRRAGLEGKRHTNPVVDGQLVPRARKTPKKRRREEPAATS